VAVRLARGPRRGPSGGRSGVHCAAHSTRGVAVNVAPNHPLEQTAGSHSLAAAAQRGRYTDPDWHERTVKGGEPIPLLEDDGWRLARTRGSHRQYKHTTKSGPVTVAAKPSLDPSWNFKCHTEASWPQEGEVGMAMMRYIVVVERGETSWGAHVPDLPG